MTNWIWITTQKEFVHHYPEAPRSVSFLRNEHRHIFKFKVWIQVYDNDREIEFFIFQRFIKGLLKQFDYDLKMTSCEMLSDKLYQGISDKYNDKPRKVMIEVSEDGENGSFKEYL